ncbi:hypothetical protein AFAEC_2156 [Aliarcobacter faecis]|uniref:hypothetical protein n=1 Tax=Aliarcobacter faecis TaxID=1564138 RepID=UPI0004B23495|nr:hypothetical protein [Aliarcobacter faecis]QKF74301.1 hypothetical protein AFAEC_2156 [Aliarcobacter faecis]
MKKLLLSAVLCVSLNADINQAVLGILGSSDYNTHKNLINHIFKNEQDFYTDGKLDYSKISEELEKNNLLKVVSNISSGTEITFNFNTNPKISFKNMNDILKVVGIQNYTTKSQTTIDNQLQWSIKVQTAAAINPLKISNELKSANCRVVDIKKEGNKLSYYIDSSNASIYKAENLTTQNEVVLKRASKPYFIELGSMYRVNITSNAGNSWYPLVTFYDKGFNAIEVVEKESLEKSLKLVVPNGAKFMKIDDFYALTNIKNGLTVTKE